MQVTVVGWAGSFPGPGSPASCYLVEADGFRLVLDLGNGALGVLQRYADLGEIDAICLSHLHADHCLDMVGYCVYQTHHPDGQRPRIPVYGPAGTADRLERARSAGAGPQHAGGKDRMADAFDFAVLAPGSIEIGPLRLTAAHMRHPVETFGFRIEHAGQAVAYSADTAPCDDLVSLADGADLLLAEASFADGSGLRSDQHLTARQAGEHAARAGAGGLVLTHLVSWNDPATLLEQAAAAYAGPVRLAGTGLRLLPAGDRPAGPAPA